MFFHNLKYEILVSLRAKDLIIWLMIFPVILGTLFKIAFGNVYDKDIVFDTVPVAVVENEENETFRSVIKGIEEKDEPMLKASYVDESKALEMLKADEVKGIIYVDKDDKKAKEDEKNIDAGVISMITDFASTAGQGMNPTKLSLRVASNSIESTILKKFLEAYTTQESVVYDALKNNIGNIQNVIDSLSEELFIEDDVPLTDGNTDPYATYFFNLIAMVALFGSTTGLHIAIVNQGNLSDLGARRCCSPTSKFGSLMAGLVGSYIAQAVCVILSITFSVLVLGVDFRRLPLVFVAGIVGGIMGVSMGFFIGSIGNMSQNMKVGISMFVTMPLCFLSGLMMGDMKTLLASNAPIVNDLNPAALIADSMYVLNVDADLGRFFIKMLTLAGYSVLFVALGILLTRRKKYASL